MATTTPTSPKSPTGAQLGALGRTGRAMARHHRWVGLVWLVLLIVAGWLNNAYASKTSDAFSIPGTNSQAAYDLLNSAFPNQNNATATLVFVAPQGQTLTSAAGTQAVTSVLAAVAGATDVDGKTILNPITQNPQSSLGPNVPSFLATNGEVAFTNITFDKSLVDLLSAYPPNAEKAAGDYSNPYSALQQAISSVNTNGVQVLIGGPIADTWNQPVSWFANHADELGLGLGAILLLIAFGSIFGMAIPIATALFGAVTAGGLVYFVASLVTVSSAAPKVTLMIAIGVGLDYSLLIVTRHRQFLRAGHSVDDAVGMASATAGKSALFAGITVAIALLGLLLVPIPLVQTMGVAAAIGVVVMIIASITLLPCLLGFAGHKIDRFRVPFSFRDTSSDPENSFWGRFATRMSKRPWLTLVAGTAFLLFCAYPALHMDFGMPDDSSLPTYLSQQKAYSEVLDSFGPGANGPLIVAVSVPGGTSESIAQTLQPLTKALGVLQPANTVPGIEYAVGPIPNTTGDAAIYQITPTSSPDSNATSDLVRTIRSNLATATAGTNVQAYVGGSTATLIDLTNLVVHYLPWVVGAVVLGAFLLLILVFRSILVPLKAALMNLISIAAAYGIVVAVFQWGWMKSLLGLHTTIPIVSFVPLIMFVILFGLSMDYEVFLMSRIAEEWEITQDPRKSVVLGVANTARVITTAALIMIAVFSSFITIQNPTIQVLGFGMAIAVLLDSTVVRMVLVPAIMELLGKAAWWFPSWLEWLPHLNVEGSPELLAAEKAQAAEAAEAVSAR